MHFAMYRVLSSAALYIVLLSKLRLHRKAVDKNELGIVLYAVI